MSVVKHQSEALVYSPSIASHGSYRMNRVLPQGSSTVTLSAGSTIQTLIDVPNKCYNLAKSALEFDISVAGGGAGTYNRLHAIGQNAIERISLYTRSSVYLADLPNCALYTRAITPVVTPLEDFLDADNNLGAATVADAAAKGRGANFFRSNVLQGSVAPGADHAPNGVRISATGAGEIPTIPYTEPTYFTQAGNNAAAAYSFSVPLSAFHHTLLSVDKDLYFNQSLVLSIHWAPTDHMGWKGTDPAVIQTTPTLLGATTITNLRLSLAVEVNDAIANSIRQKVLTEGMGLNIPYVYGYLYNSTAGTSSSQQVRLNRGHGSSLLNVYSVIASTTTTGRLSKDINNVAEAKVVSFQSSVDNSYMQESVPLCANNEDYILCREMLKGSCIQDSRVYKGNRVFINSWRQGRTIEWKHTDTVVDGLSLESERIYNMDSTTANLALRQYLFCVCQRQLMIGSDGQVIVM